MLGCKRERGRRRVLSVGEILTLRNWLIGAWIVAYRARGADRARYGEGLIDALAAAFKARGVSGLGRSNLKNYRQIALTWPMLGIRQTSGESRRLRTFARHCLANWIRPARAGRRCLPNSSLP